MHNAAAMYGTSVTLCANGVPIWSGKVHGRLDKTIETVVKWRRRSEGKLGDLLTYLEYPVLIPRHLRDTTVDRLTYMWFDTGKAIDYREVVL